MLVGTSRQQSSTTMSLELLCFPFLWTEYVQQHRQLINKTLHITLYLGLHTWPAYVPRDIQPALQPVGRGMPTAGLRDGCKAEWRGARRWFLPAISGCPAEISNVEGTAGNGAAEDITVHPAGNIPVSTGHTATTKSYCPATTAGGIQCEVQVG